MDAALAGEVDDAVHGAAVEDGVDGRGVVQVRLEERGEARASPRRAAVGAHEAHRFHVGMLGAEKLDEVAGHEAARARDEDPHRYIPRPCWLPRASRPLKLPIEPTLARSTLKRNCRSWRPL